MEINETLESIGLQKQEIKLYLDLLEHGHSTVAELARRTNLHRPYVYKALPHLIKKKLVTKGPFGKRTLYMAESPEKLEVALEEAKHKIQKIIPELQSMYVTVGKRPIVKYLTGIEGIETVFADIMTVLKKEDVYYRYSSVSKSVWNTYFKKNYLPKGYKQKITEKNIGRLVICGEAQAGILQKEIDVSVKIIPEKFDQFEDNIVHIVYANKVAFIDYETETAIIIESKRFANFQKKIFLLLYRKL